MVEDGGVSQASRRGDLLDQRGDAPDGRKRRVTLRDRTVLRREGGVIIGQGHREGLGRVRGGAGNAVPYGKRGNPAGKALSGNVEPFATSTCDVLHYSLPHRVY